MIRVAWSCQDCMFTSTVPLETTGSARLYSRRRSLRILHLGELLKHLEERRTPTPHRVVLWLEEGEEPKAQAPEPGRES